MSKVSKSSPMRLPISAQERAITAAAKADPDAQPLTAKQLASMIPLRSLRGRPKSANPKQLVSVRYSPEVVAYFKSTGEGWQSRMDGVLREYVTRHSRRARAMAPNTSTERSSQRPLRAPCAAAHVAR